MNYALQVYETALSDGIPNALALLIVAQSKHESANYTSSIFLDCNNSFGYKVFGNAMACPGHSDYEMYNSIVDSTHEITSWLKRRVNDGSFPDLSTITTPQQYGTLLYSAGYFTDNPINYINGLIAWYEPDIPGYINPFWIVGGMALVYFLSKRKKKNPEIT